MARFCTALDASPPHPSPHQAPKGRCKSPIFSHLPLPKRTLLEGTLMQPLATASTPGGRGVLCLLPTPGSQLPAAGRGPLGQQPPATSYQPPASGRLCDTNSRLCYKHGRLCNRNGRLPINPFSDTCSRSQGIELAIPQPNPSRINHHPAEGSGEGVGGGGWGVGGGAWGWGVGGALCPTYPALCYRLRATGCRQQAAGHRLLFRN
jgi:hypothetical protein